MIEKQRCRWATASAPEVNIPYHDEEWGVPVHDDRTLFEFLILDGFQAGLSWATILKKRDHFRGVFDNFKAAAITRYNERKIESLLQDRGIIRNRLKIEAAVKNARAFLRLQEEFGSFDRYIWGFVNGSPIVNAWDSWDDVPATSPESDAMSRDLKRRGFSFVGSTICYAFMQAAGLVNDHEIGCFRYAEVCSRTSIKQ
ncbi:DNA-3-methyladenine glycosylase I [bacterium]|nr:DNA-3-methyladenine glycosylase I [bacterium]